MQLSIIIPIYNVASYIKSVSKVYKRRAFLAVIIFYEPAIGKVGVAGT